MNKEKIEIDFSTFVEIQKFIVYINGFISSNEKIDSKVRDKISEKIDTLDEMLDDIIL